MIKEMFKVNKKARMLVGSLMKIIIILGILLSSGCFAIVDQDDNVKNYGLSREQVDLILNESDNND